MVEHEDIVERWRAIPEDVAELVEGLSDEQLSRRPAEGEWSMKEVCGHLAVDARTWQERFLLMTTQTDPYLKRIDPVAGVSEGGYQDAPMEATLGEIRRYRGESAELLSGLTADGWERTGRHWSEGEMTIAEACSMALEHAEVHVGQLRETRERVVGS